MRFLLLALALATAPLLGGCPGPTFVVQQYSGPARPPESVATLRINGSDSARIMTLDDVDVAVPLERDTRLHLELLPGPHRLTVINGSLPHEPEAAIAFKAEPGKIYRVVVAAGAAPHLWEVDRGTDATAVDVTPSPEVAPLPTPTPPPPTEPTVPTG